MSDISGPAQMKAHCMNAKCNWSGGIDDCAHHWNSSRTPVCPQCYELVTIEEITEIMDALWSSHSATGTHNA